MELSANINQGPMDAEGMKLIEQKFMKQKNI